jgi:hypothetical protein
MTMPRETPERKRYRLKLLRPAFTCTVLQYDSVGARLRGRLPPVARRRHDKAGGLNYVVPELGELETALKVVSDWFERVRKYKF